MSGGSKAGSKGCKTCGTWSSGTSRATTALTKWTKPSASTSETTVIDTPVTIIGDHDDKTIEQIHTCATTGRVVGAALMPDGHLGYSMPIGGVVAYDDAVSPSGVGFDIGCGVKAVRCGLDWNEIEPFRDQIADDIARTVTFGLGRENDEAIDHPVMDSYRWDTLPADVRKQKNRFAKQLGTVGSGNHYVDILEDEAGYVWIAVHFGSRGFGHTFATWALKECGASDGMMVPPAIIDADRDEELFDTYINGMNLAGEYAYAGRDIVVQQVLDILGCGFDVSVHNHHNFAWYEKHDGQGLWVVRKGATPSGVPGFVGGSMGDISAVVQGKLGHVDGTFRSTVHGAGRIMSRTRAAGKYKKIDGKRQRIAGEITKEMYDVSLMKHAPTIRGGGFDECPLVYRQLQPVLDALEDSIDVLHTMTPRIVCMAGADVKDPYKD